MGLFKKRPDPIHESSRALNSKIAALESEIKELNTKIHQTQAQPRLRSTALPNGAKAKAASEFDPNPVFEPLEAKSNPSGEPDSTSAHYNDLGVRKYDLFGSLRRMQQHFRGPPANNPKLVSYLAAGSIKGLRPLRYEKRVARNRFVALFIFFVLILWGIIAVLFGRL